jgi:hypothetical protein
MRKTNRWSLVLIAGLGVAAYLFLNNPFLPDRSHVEELSQRFMEDLQFKDFRSSALYHHALDRDRVDVGRTLETLFLVKPEMLDIREYRIVKAEVDSSGNRARVHLNTKFQRLNLSEKPEEGEIILYWLKRHPDCPVGATCPTGICVDEFQKVIHRPKEEDKKKKKQSDKESERRDRLETGLTGKSYTCSPDKEKTWFMNLDSTLKEKRYRRK